MKKKIRWTQRGWLTLLILICSGTILIGCADYVKSLRQDLMEQSVANVLTVTSQQQQAFDNFIAGDRERLHSFAGYFSQHASSDMRSMERQLTLFDEVDAIYSIINLESGQFCNNKDNIIYQLSPEELAGYRRLSGSGVRDSYTGLYTNDLMFGYYECFTFSDGVPGLIQKSYSRTKVMETFSLSFYNDQGFAYVVTQKGDILLRSDDSAGSADYENILSMLNRSENGAQDASRLADALYRRETGSFIFSGQEEALVYSYVPISAVEDWYLVSVIPAAAISAENDEILLSSQRTMLLFFVVLVVFGGFMLLVWYTHRDLKAKDQEIQYQEELFDIFSTYLSNSMDDVYLMLDLDDRRVDYVSPNVERVLGIPPAEIMGNIKAVGQAQYAIGEYIGYEELEDMRPGTSLESIQTERTNRKTGAQRRFQESVYCTRMQDRVKIVAYMSDRTQDWKARDDLQDALKLAQVANEAKSSFLSSISHDIRTPMNAIMGLTTLLKDEAENPVLVREYTQRIDAASQHLLELINDVLDMNKIESGNATLNISEINLADIIDEINTIMRPQAKARSQDFHIYASSFTYEHLLGDKLRINQVLINILSNAIKYTPEGGRIQVLVAELPQIVDGYSRIRFVVRDNGLGMSEEYQKVMFDAFTREKAAVEKQIQGTGLGMAITKSLVDLMGGSIKVQSKLGEGTTFIVELELRIQKVENDQQFWKDYNISRIFVADDEESTCRNIVRAMSGTGVEVSFATDGETALHMIREAREDGKPYDIVLLDWKMPGLDGLETARQLRGQCPERIPILIFTAYDWSEIEGEAAEIGVHHFMQKPFFLSSFKDALCRIMGSSAAAGEEEDVVKGRRILIVDDIEVNRMILMKILHTLGAECDTAENGQLAVEAFEKAPPGTYDLILMDVQMPVMDGYAATRAIRASSHPSAESLPIIAMTANAFVDDVRDAIDAGMDAHVAKPVQMDKLKATIRQVFEQRKQS